MCLNLGQKASPPHLHAEAHGPVYHKAPLGLGTEQLVNQETICERKDDTRHAAARLLSTARN